MAGKTISFIALCNLGESQLEHLSKWLSCNDELWGIGPTIVFASAAVLFLYHELEEAIYVRGDEVQITNMEKTLIASMVLGMLSLMVHLWVCLMRFFQYYLDTLIRDSPSMIIEMTTLGLLGSDLVPFGPLTKFLRQQQPQIHITVCWFLALCYADYVRKRYCRRFNMPYLEQWQTEMQRRASRGVSSTVAAVSSFVGCLQQKLRGFSHPDDQRQSNMTNVTCCHHQQKEYTVKELLIDRQASPSPAQPLEDEVLAACRTSTRKENCVFTLPLEPCPIVTLSKIYFPMEDPFLHKKRQPCCPQAQQASSTISETSSKKQDARVQDKIMTPTIRFLFHKARHKLKKLTNDED